MFGFIRTIIHPVMRSWVGALADSAEGIPQAGLTGSHSVDGPRKLRILLIGGGRAAGYGVLSHDMGFTGYLTRTLAAILDRGVGLDAFTSVRLTATRALAAAELVDADAYDVVILMVGTYDLVVLTPAASFGSRMEKLVDRFDSGEDGPVLFVAEIPRLPSATGIRGVPTSLGNKHLPRLAAELDGVLRKHPSAIALQLTDPVAADVNDRKMAKRYLRWGAEAASAIAVHLGDL
jgi:hypothetical protein